MTQIAPTRKEVTLPRGAYTKIAKRLRPKVTPQHVRLVAIGERTSVRVSAAIERFLEAERSAA
jgi:hypothetical protein